MIILGGRKALRRLVEAPFAPLAALQPRPHRGKPPPMDPQTLTLAAFQKHIFDKYEKVDRARGTPKTFIWFIEEIGELATALNGDDRANLEEEFADVLAWLCTLANINDVDLAAALAKKYLGEKPPQGHK
jgi:NTP pyrophosphatase (non-canonical NTP hydrolase)